MAATIHTFPDLFQTTFEQNGEPILLKKIVIPMIQRDYAQGRRSAEIVRVRSRFLDALYQAVLGEPIILDFIYGDINAEGIMTPLDGQQRLTTLFLLYWYAAKRDRAEVDEYQFLENFSYETRYSARDFCKYLLSYSPMFLGILSEELIDQAWFPLDWLQDPTIDSMLVMLDCIAEKFQNITDLWGKLKEKKISFYFLPIKEMGLTDELYIKMNSRGRPLTLFEHFKAEMEHEFEKIDKELAERIIRKVDLDWTDLLWEYKSETNEIDDSFLRYFHFICDVICYRSGDSPQGKDQDEFVLLKTYFGQENKKAAENICFLEEYFDCWCRLKKEQTPKAFFEKVFSYILEDGKIRIDNRYEIDLLKDCLHTYFVINQSRTFSLNRFVLLYAVISYLLLKEPIAFEEFVKRIRIVHNLVQNSEDELSDSENRVGGNRMPAILRQVDSIMLSGKIDPSIEKNFNGIQIMEEIEKLKWAEKNKEKVQELYRLEDHELLYGQIGIVGLEHPEYFSRFYSLFACDYDLIDCALLSVGNYAQREKNGWRFQLGSASNQKAWRNLFHKSATGGFECTKQYLAELLSKTEHITNQFLEEIREHYIWQCEEKKWFDWKYYYVKYRIFRPGRFGKYGWQDYEKKPYELAVMYTERNWSQNTYQPFLKEIDLNGNISRDDFGMSLDFGDCYMRCENDGYITREKETDEVTEKIEILQNKEGIDKEDRIRKYLEIVYQA